MRKYSSALAQHLSITALFDRDIHIRRAASAAFQEIVGRLGILPRGIAVVQAMDFHAVGQRRSAFLTAAPTVAQYNEYRPALLTHLLEIGISHWDISMRSLAAPALAALVKLDLSQLQSTIDILVRTRSAESDLADPSSRIAVERSRSRHAARTS